MSLDVVGIPTIEHFQQDSIDLLVIRLDNAPRSLAGRKTALMLPRFG
jgi:hypothetical protein